MVFLTLAEVTDGKNRYIETETKQDQEVENGNE